MDDPVDVLRAIMDERHQAHAREHELIDKALQTAQGLREQAITQAREVVDDRLAHLNALREDVLTDRATFVTRDLFDSRMKPVEEFRSRALGFSALVAVSSAVVGSLVTAWMTGAL